MSIKDNPKKILVLRFSAFGDLINATAAVRALKLRYPEAEIDFLAARGFESALENCPQVHRIIVLDRGRNLRKLGPFLKLALELRRGHYDWLVNCQRNSRSRVLARLIGAGATNPCAPKADYKTRGFNTNVLDVIAGEILGFFDPELVPDPQMLSWNTPSEMAFASEFFASHGLDLAPVIAINPGGNWASKQWPVNNWISLSRKIVDELQMRVMVMGGPDDVDRARNIIKGVGAGVVSCAGKTTFRSASALVSRCRVMVSNDSGLMHLAAAAGIPVVALFGSTNGGYHGPKAPRGRIIQADLDCVPCYLKTCPSGLNCMGAIDPDSVFEQLMDLLDSKSY